MHLDVCHFVTGWSWLAGDLGSRATSVTATTAMRAQCIDETSAMCLGIHARTNGSSVTVR